MTRRLYGIVLVAALVTLVLCAGSLLAQSPTQDAPVLDALRDTYRNAARGWLARLVPIAQRLFVLLAGIEFAVSGAVWALRRESLDDMAAKFLLKFTLVAFLLALITSFQYWIPPIINGFAAAGERAIGQSATVSPSDIIDIGRENAMVVLSTLRFGVIPRHGVFRREPHRVRLPHRDQDLLPLSRGRHRDRDRPQLARADSQQRAVRLRQPVFPGRRWRVDLRDPDDLRAKHRRGASGRAAERRHHACAPRAQLTGQ